MNDNIMNQNIEYNMAESENMAISMNKWICDK
jgi:hypothetical protein